MSRAQRRARRRFVRSWWRWEGLGRFRHYDANGRLACVVDHRRSTMTLYYETLLDYREKAGV